jgi:Flp pilus assembly protein TadG
MMRTPLTDPEAADADRLKRRLRQVTEARRRVERGAAIVEFAIILPVLLLIICGILDFGLMFGGYLSLEGGVASGARLASIGQYQYGGSLNCSGPNSATANLVCTVAAAIGNPVGTTGTLAIGVCFVTPGSATTGCSTETSTGTSVTQDVEICAQVTLRSTTGFTAPFINGRVASSSSRLVLEQPQPSGATSFTAFNSSSGVVTYGSHSIQGMNCS